MKTTILPFIIQVNASDGISTYSFELPPGSTFDEFCVMLFQVWDYQIPVDSFDLYNGSVPLDADGNYPDRAMIGRHWREKRVPRDSGMTEFGWNVRKIFQELLDYQQSNPAPRAKK